MIFEQMRSGTVLPSVARRGPALLLRQISGPGLLRDLFEWQKEDSFTVVLLGRQGHTALKATLASALKYG